jgi:chemotaxis response regulator CheB
VAKILVVDDDAVSALVLTRALTQAGHEVEMASTGLQAFEQLRGGTFAVLVTDWMMPDLDGLELIRRVHQHLVPAPVIVMVTCLESPQAQAHALASGADEFLVKPVSPKEAVDAVRLALTRHRDAGFPSGDVRATIRPRRSTPTAAPFPLVVVGANAAGPAALRLLLRGLPREASCAALVLAQHLQPQMLVALVEVLQRETRLEVVLGTPGMALQPGRVILGPGTHDIEIAARMRCIELTAGSADAHVRPAADPLFRAAAETFGPACIGVILTGMGRDGTLGAAAIRARGGTVVVVAPGPLVASAMPESAIRAGHASVVVPVDRIGEAVGREIVAAPVAGHAAVG